MKGRDSYEKETLDCIMFVGWIIFRCVVIGGTACDLIMENEDIDMKSLEIRGRSKEKNVRVTVTVLWYVS